MFDLDIPEVTVSSAYRQSEFAADIDSGTLDGVPITTREHPAGVADQLMVEYRATFEALEALDDDPDGFLEYGSAQLDHRDVDPTDLYRQLWPAGQWHTTLPSVPRSRATTWQSDPYGHALGLPWVPEGLITRAPFPAPSIRLHGYRIPFPASRVVSTTSMGSWAGRFPNRTKDGEPSIDTIDRYARLPVDTMPAGVYLEVFVDAAGEHWAYAHTGGHHRAAAQRLRGDQWMYATQVEIHHPDIRPFVEFSVREMIHTIAHRVNSRTRIEAWTDRLQRHRHQRPKHHHQEWAEPDNRESPWDWLGVDSWTDSGPWRPPGHPRRRFCW